MKNIYFFLFISLFCHPLFLLAQQDDYLQKTNHAFALVDKSHVSTGILYDYGFPFIDVSQFNGVCTADNYADISHWRKAYASLSSGRVNNNLRNGVYFLQVVGADFNQTIKVIVGGTIAN